MKIRVLYISLVIGLLVMCLVSCSILSGNSSTPSDDNLVNPSDDVDDGGSSGDQDEHVHSYVIADPSSHFLVFEATCTSSAVYCYSCECGEKGAKIFESGDPLDHVWKSADCMNPKTCELCGVTEGSAEDHSWVDATCQAPKHCVFCGTVTGAVAKHNYDGISCTVCGKLIGDDDGTELPVIPLD